MKLIPHPSTASEKRIAVIAGRNSGFKAKDVAAVNRILTDVKKNGDAALIRYTRSFDAPTLTTAGLRVTRDEIEDALKTVERAFVRALNRAVRQIEDFHRRQRQQSWMSLDRPGVMLGQLVNPVPAAGIYVPGGKGGQTPLVSSVLMGAIPAAVAGVPKIVMTTPPTQTGSIDPHLLVAAHKAGVQEIYKAGSAWAIAALAYGTPTVPRVDVIVGPGNIYVTLAKKIVAGDVGIDMIAGPSEILIIADDSAVPEFVAADLLSQAEHDPLSSAILVTTSQQTGHAVLEALQAQLDILPRKTIAAAALKNYGGALLVPDIETAVDLSNRIAPEHLELQVESPFSVLGRIRNAGAVFVGNYTPEPVGDYIAGPNHVLPTAGTARYASALSVDHFTKKTSLVHYDRDAFRREAGDIQRIARVEGLSAHANAVRIRLK